ncbi:MAG: YdcF family protein [bacterium]|nr:YdcF family protein [bacterium]
MTKTIHKFNAFLKNHRYGLFVTGLVFLTFGLINHVHIGSYSKFIIDDSNLEMPEVAIVLGGGIINGKPRPLLQDRLNAAVNLIQQGKINKITLSGDNRVEEYNEPQAMQDYLINEKSINPKLIQLDNAGRSTYETCERASKVFGLKKALLISESTHLPRAIYLCRNFGLEAYGFVSDGQSSSGLKLGQRWREVLARTKAAVNIYIAGENTLLGERIEI